VGRLATPAENTALCAPISILKPFRAATCFYACIRSHAAQHYPEFEILSASAIPPTPAIEDIESLQREFPTCRFPSPGVPQRRECQAGVLAELARQAAMRFCWVNDGDIFVPPGYLDDVVRRFPMPETGLVTCLYRAHGGSPATAWRPSASLTDFAPSGLWRGFWCGRICSRSTRPSARDAARYRRLETIFDYLADDYQLGATSTNWAAHRVRGRVVKRTWAPVRARCLRHQLRWARTIRVSRFSGYCGSIVTHATLWSLVARWPEHGGPPSGPGACASRGHLGRRPSSGR